ncbi:MAG TPA: terminase family protein [Anaerohalosphaeraceae bacterium]|nr:terminase family protein [Anaerohalosphaeraceae bacterium]HQG06862.1 terminase family protein [Anaerohalosphaeraceae bacterium]HQI08445.1 terminase family protein [Anaerohalosphaeraceae bacterium]HQJ68764.1 terminase family protein [Anaerohalosphaeraceae bacterium]
MTEPLINLLPYQKRWLLDDSRYKIALQARQTGKSFMASLEAVDQVYQTGETWVLLSRGERQSRELMEKAAQHARAYALGISAVEEERFRGDENEYKMLTIHFPNGGRIIGLPANPDTARGFSAHVVLDEFALHKDSHKIWTALYGSITRGYKIRILSTPMGKQNKFYSLWTGNQPYSRHFVDIYTAVREGLKVDIEALRSGLDDPDAWAQEYECKFIDEATAFLTYELISACESEQAALESAEISAGGEYYAGIDIGRKRDLTILWLLEKVGDVYWTRRVQVLEKTPFPMQTELLAETIRRLRPRRVCVDYTGMGGPICEQLQKLFGSSRIEPVTFTPAVKESMAVRVRQLFEDRRIRIPVDNAVRNDLHAVRKIVTAAGNIRYDAEHTADGHSDRFWALALALEASDAGAVKPMCYVSRRA